MGGEMKYGSVCSGIEAATTAWHPLGWQASFYSEIEPFPRAVLAHHYPHVPLHGDFTTIRGNEYESIDLLVGGTPCQSFSVAGLRGGLDDDRGNLALEFLRLADRTRPRWLVWENVPGVLSSNGGRDFGSILGGMVQLGYGIAYRVLDAQFFGVAQRRRRVFVVGYLGDWRRAAAVLFERHSLQGHPAPRREAGEGVAGTLGGSSQSGGFRTTDLDNNGAFIPVVGKTLLSFGHASNPLDENLISFAAQVRRLTPRECERLQGFPDDYTLVSYRGKPAADSPRYKALGNSMAVPVMRWIGRRIAASERRHAA
jgi:DNA (cytosine-5)-methyltransferase 1